MLSFLHKLHLGFDIKHTNCYIFRRLVPSALCFQILILFLCVLVILLQYKLPLCSWPENDNTAGCQIILLLSPSHPHRWQGRSHLANIECTSHFHVPPGWSPSLLPWKFRMVERIRTTDLLCSRLPGHAPKIISSWEKWTLGVWSRQTEKRSLSFQPW